MKMPNEILNEFFDNINYDVSAYSDVVNYQHLERFFFKCIAFVVILIIAQTLLYYSVNNISKLGRERKGNWLSFQGRKIKLKSLSKEKITVVHLVYISAYVLIYGIAGYLLLKGVI